MTTLLNSIQVLNNNAEACSETNGRDWMNLNAKTCATKQAYLFVLLQSV